MKKQLFFIALFFTVINTFSQNVGIGTTTPTNTLHIVVAPVNPNQDPVKIEGIKRYTNEDSVIVVNPSTGIIKYMPIADVINNIPANLLDSLILNLVLNNTDTIYNNQTVRDSVLSILLGNIDTIFTITRDSLLLDTTFINTLRDSIDTDIDSVTFLNDTIYIYENGKVVQTHIQTSLDTGLVDSLIYAKSDSLYTFMSDSLNKDTLWIKQLDSLLSIYGDTVYFNDSSYTLIRDSLLKDSLFLDSLISMIGDSIDTDIDSVTFLNDTIYIYEDGKVVQTHIQTSLDTGLVDSLIYAKSDSLYTFISDSLNKDTLWIKQLDSLLSIYGDTVYFNDTSYTLISDSLLKDSLWIDSLGKLINDNDWNINANGTGLEAAPANNNVASGIYSIVGGYADTATGAYSSIIGGQENRALASYSNVLGGYQNYTNSSYSSVSGYRDSVISSSYSSVLSGRENRLTSSSYATISGGYRNKITSSSYANASGYLNIVTSSSYANIGGSQNYISDFSNNNIFGYKDTLIRNLEGSFITGASNSSIAAPGALTGRNFISGLNNQSYVPFGNDSFLHTILGGRSNRIVGNVDNINDDPIAIISSQDSRVLPGFSGNNRTVIVGGYQDTMHGSQGTVMIGGERNKASNNGIFHVIVGGGDNKIAQEWYSGIFVGLRNRMTNSGSSAIIAGRDNQLTSGTTMSTIIGGDSNIVNNAAKNAITIAGRGNTSNNFSQVTLGHFSTNTIPVGSSASAIAPDNILFKIGNGTSSAALSDAMVVKANGNTGIGVANPQRTVHIKDVIRLEPSATPASPSAGDIYFDSTTNKLRCFDGTIWNNLF